MPQPTDIILNGAGYMIEPGTYKRLQDGYPEGATARTTQTDFFGGQRRALQLERDTFGTSLNVGPVLGGQGVQPWAPSAVRAPMTIPTGDLTPVGGTRIPYQVVEGRVYFAIGKTLYFRNYEGSASGAVTVKSYPNQITDITVYAHTGLLIAFGTAAPIIYRTLAGVETTFVEGEYGGHIQGYAGYALWSDARPGTKPTNIRLSTGSGVEERVIDYAPIQITVVDGEVVIVTKQAIYKFNGRVRSVMAPNPAWTKTSTTEPQSIRTLEWTGDFRPFFQQGIHTERDDFRFVLGYGGRTLAWISGGVYEFVPTGDRAGWRSTDLTGLQCYGGCVAAGYLVVALLSEYNMMELWAYDGAGWWRFGATPYTSSGNWNNPMPIGGGSGNHDIAVLHHNTPNVTTYRLAPRSGGDVALAPDAEYVSSMIDAGQRDKVKAWRKVGAVFASPEKFGPTSSDVVAVYLEYSTDAGASWTTAGSLSLTGNTIANMNQTIERALTDVSSRFIMLRVKWQSVTDWAPILVGLYVEHEVLNVPSRRRKWEFSIHARDQEVNRNGQLLNRTGRELIAELWQAWEQDTPLGFRDQDYDAAPVARTVRIVGISESVAQPADANLWGESLISIKLVEV